MLAPDHQVALRAQQHREEVACGVAAAMPMLVRVAGNLTRGRGPDPHDLAQGAALKAIEHADLFQPGTNLDAWLVTILKNSFMSGLRRQRFEVVGEAGDAADLYANSSRIGAGGERDAIARLDLARLACCLSRLPPDQQEVVELVVVQGRSYEEAALVLAVPDGTIKSQLSRARDQLLAMMGEEYQPAGSRRHRRHRREEEDAWARLRAAGAVDAREWEGE